MKIVCITGTRADYGIFRPLLLQIEQDRKMQLQLIVTGMHLLHEYGHTMDEVIKDGLTIADSPRILCKGDDETAMVQSLGMATLYFSNAFDRLRPNAVLLLGDRLEMMAGALAAHYQNIPIIHLHGGEKSGSADDAIRHCISLLANVHLVSCAEARAQLMTMGILGNTIYQIGSLRKTEILALAVKKESLQKQFDQRVPFKQHDELPFVVLVMHPDSKENTPYTRQLGCLLEAMQALELQGLSMNVLTIGANSDAGGEQFNEALNRFAKSLPERRVFLPSLSSELYLYVLSLADVLIGNTSSGIIEAPFFKLPYVNIGMRQYQRAQGDNVIAAPYEAKQIQKAIRYAMKMDRATLVYNPYETKHVPEKEAVSVIKSFCLARQKTV